ncbi:MAG: methyltransferase type 11, partial [Pseudomonadota bacterium]|nr:methyltransferase type 11 [Pseudomonadota bacterium]
SGQLKRMLRNCLFTPVQTEHALYLPPTQRRVILHSAPAFERVGDRFFHAISGVVMVEATKQIYAATPAVKATRRRGLIALPGRGEAINSRDATDGFSNLNYR